MCVCACVAVCIGLRVGVCVCMGVYKHIVLYMFKWVLPSHLVMADRVSTQREAFVYRMAPGAAENVRVVLRVRPLTRKESDRGEEELIRVASEQAVQVIHVCEKV